MGGVKKKPLSAVEKALRRRERRLAEKEKKEKVERAVSLDVSEEEVLKALRSLKAITVHGVARSLGIRASVANSLIRGLEAKGVVTKVGGWSGHYVWKLTS